MLNYYNFSSVLWILCEFSNKSGPSPYPKDKKRYLYLLVSIQLRSSWVHTFILQHKIWFIFIITEYTIKVVIYSHETGETKNVQKILIVEREKAKNNENNSVTFVAVFARTLPLISPLMMSCLDWWSKSFLFSFLSHLSS